MGISKYPLRMIPATKDYIWGGERLAAEYGKRADKLPIAESWEISCHPDGLSVISNGEYAGITLKEYIDKDAAGILGRRRAHKEDLPILVKLIDAKEALSVQVHPGEEYARRVEGGRGKAELWVVLACDGDSMLVYGVNRPLTAAEFGELINANTLEDCLNKVPVCPGDVLFVPPGLIHAIGKGILLAEIQQSSNLSYRIWDYGRVGRDGKPRELHIKKAMEVATLMPTEWRRMKRSATMSNGCSMEELASCEYFEVKRLACECGAYYGECTDDGFVCLLCVKGQCSLTWEDELYILVQGDAFFLPAGIGRYKIEGCGSEVLIIT